MRPTAIPIPANHLFWLSALFLAALLGTAQLNAQTPGRVEQVTVHATSLEGNLNGDSPDRAVFIYLPPGYDSNPNKRYPVVYLLHGYGLRAERWMTLFNIEAALNTAMTGSGGGVGTGERAREMIVVNPDCYSFFDGCFYSSSVANGDWERFIAEELVAYVDANYRTLAKRESRGLGGHSMGGYGTLRIGMKRPDVFSALYPLAAAAMFESGEPSEGLTAAQSLTTREDVAALRYPDKSTLARAAAWSANPQKPPLYVDLPVAGEKEVPEIQAKWLANSILPLLGQYTHNLRRYTAIQFDVGTEDGLIEANRRLDAAMTEAGIPHTFVTYEGDHNNRISERIETAVMPFFSKHLQFE
ncbi:MAG: alpha/beta fold hydrolase [Pseudomonadota bacterium]|nr:alpha/beta fold hydrolase [Pseudomonadota bacterium]